MLIKLFTIFTLAAALVGPASAASVEVRPVGEQDGRTIYAVALAGDIKSRPPRCQLARPGARRGPISRLYGALVKWWAHKRATRHCAHCA